jgi:PAS domain S-box-containing protein
MSEVDARTKEGRVGEPLPAPARALDDGRERSAAGPVDLEPPKSLEAERGARILAQRFAERMSRLLSVATELGAAITTEAVAKVIVEHSVEAFAATTGSLWVLDASPRRLRMLRSRGYGGAAQRYALISVDAPLPIAEAIRERASVFVGSWEDYLARYAPLDMAPLETPAIQCAAVACLPLLAGERVLGGLALAFAGARRFEAEDRTFLDLLAGQCAQALERARLYEEEVKAQARLAGILGSAMDGIVTVDDQLRIVLLNAAAERMFRCPAHEAIGTSIDRFIPERYRSADLSQVWAFGATASAMEATGRVGTLVGLRASGEEFPVEATISHAVAGGQQLYTVILRDVSERKRAEAERERLYREAQVAVRAREEFISMASHDLRTPLAAVEIQIQRVLHEIDKPGPRALSREWLKERLQRANSSIERAVQLMNDLLEQSRTSAGELEVHLEDVDIVSVVKEALGRSGEQIERAGCTLLLRCEDALGGRWDRLRLEQLFENLLSNALKYGAGQPIEVSIARRGQNAALSVRDHGMGIAEGDREAIFERFRRPSSKERQGSFGLGLWIARRIAEVLGGVIDVVSEVGVGSTFTVVLPLAGPGAARREPAPAKVAKIPETMCFEAESPAEDLGAFRGLVLQTAIDAALAARAEAEMASSMKSGFLSLVSHELRTPLTTIQLQLDRLQHDRSAQLTPKQQEAVRSLGGAYQRLVDLVESLLEYARLSAGRLELAPQVFDPRVLATEAVADMRPRAERKGLALQLVVEQTRAFRSDPRLLRLVALNLIDNATKFTERGEVAVTAGVVDGSFRLSIRDTGIGIAPHLQPLIFEAFEQAEGTAQKHTPGVGLGLALVRRITEALGGKIEVDSREGAGSTFTITVPELVSRRRAAE